MRLSRRGFFGASAGAAVGGALAGPEIARTLGESLGAASDIPMAAPMPPYSYDLTQAQNAASTLRGPPEALQLLHRERERTQRMTQLRVAQRVGGVDPDLASLRLPRATLARMQLARDTEYLSLWDSLMRQISDFKW